MAPSRVSRSSSPAEGSSDADTAVSTCHHHSAHSADDRAEGGYATVSIRDGARCRYQRSDPQPLISPDDFPACYCPHQNERDSQAFSWMRRSHQLRASEFGTSTIKG